jgi:hypothetical protein
MVGPQRTLIAKGSLHAVANRLNINDSHSTPDSAVPYFLRTDLGPNTGDVECVDNDKRHAFGAGMIGIDQSLKFIAGTTYLQQLPIFADFAISETMGPLCQEFDPASSNNIGVQLTKHTNARGNGINLNRTCITKVFPNPAVGRKPDDTQPTLNVTAKKSKRISFDDISHKDDSIMGVNWGSIGQIFSI